MPDLEHEEWLENQRAHKATALAQQNRKQHPPVQDDDEDKAKRGSGTEPSKDDDDDDDDQDEEDMSLGLSVG